MLRNRAIRREEALRVSRGFEPLHAPLPLAGGLVGVLRTVVKVPVLAVLHPRQHLLLRGPVAFEIVGDDHPRYVGQSLQQLAEKLLRRLLVSTVLDKNIQDMAILIDGPPEGVPGPIDRQKHLVQVPLVARPGASTA